MRLRHLLLPLGIGFIVSPASAQQHTGHEGHAHDENGKCISHIVLEEQLQDPAVRAQYEAFQEAMDRYVSDPSVRVQRNAGKRIIPVVVHVLHSGGSENISDEKIYQQIQTLNDDYQRRNADTVNTPHRFRATEEAWFTFTSDDPADYAGQQRYISIFTPDSASTFSFWFNDGVATTAPSQAPGTRIAVSIASAADRNAIATAFSNAVNARQEFVTRTDTDGGNPRVKVIGQYAGDAPDFRSSQSLNAVTDHQRRDGAIVAADSEIEFRLATKDPLGNCTNGIVRVYTDNINDVRDNTGFKSLSYWNAYSYLNIWVVKSIASFAAGQSVLGYAQFPATGLLSTDGITVISSNIGLPNQGGRTATHEVGHWLSLIHVWGDAECGSDQVADTPPARQPNFGICGNASGGGYHWDPYNAQVCDADNLEGEMFSNYMDYSSDFCMNQFTMGQKARMDFILGGDVNNAGIRSFLISQENLEQTGTADPYVYDAAGCQPISQFHHQSNTFSRQAMICAGGKVNFRSDAYNSTVTSHNWSFPGGEPATSTSANPNNITYNTAGTYDVSLTVANAGGASNSHTNEQMVIVSPQQAEVVSAWGYVDNFWQADHFNDHYIVFNHDGNENKWEWYEGPYGGSYGFSSVRMMNFDNVVGRVDEMISPAMDLSVTTNPRLKFMWSGAARNTSPNDRLRIYFSTNCGETWGAPRLTLSAFQLVNSGLASTSYVPNQQSVWSEVDLAMGNVANASNVRVKFEWTSGGGGNNFYIDQLTIGDMGVSAEALERDLGLTLYPNPTDESATLQMSLESSARLRVTLVDLVGRNMADIHNGTAGIGSHKFQVDMAGKPAGIYFVRVEVDGNATVKKLVKN